MIEYASQSRIEGSCIPNVLLMNQCLRARLWENSPHILMQLGKIGPTISTAFVNAGINKFSDLKEVSERKIEALKCALSAIPVFKLTLRESENSPKKVMFVVSVDLTNFDEVNGRPHQMLTRATHKVFLLILLNNKKILHLQKFYTHFKKDRCWSKCISVDRTNEDTVDTTVKAYLTNLEYVGIDKIEILNFKSLQSSTFDSSGFKQTNDEAEPNFDLGLSDSEGEQMQIAQENSTTMKEKSTAMKKEVAKSLRRKRKKTVPTKTGIQKLPAKTKKATPKPARHTGDLFTQCQSKRTAQTQGEVPIRKWLKPTTTSTPFHPTTATYTNTNINTSANTYTNASNNIFTDASTNRYLGVISNCIGNDTVTASVNPQVQACLMDSRLSQGKECLHLVPPTTRISESHLRGKDKPTRSLKQSQSTINSKYYARNERRNDVLKSSFRTTVPVKSTSPEYNKPASLNTVHGSAFTEVFGDIFT